MCTCCNALVCWLEASLSEYACKRINHKANRARTLRLCTQLLLLPYLGVM